MLAYCSNDPHSPWSRGPKYDAATLTVPPYMHDNAETRAALAAYFGEITQLDSQVGSLMDLLEKTKQVDDTLVLFVSEQGCSLPYGGKWSLYDTGARVSAIMRYPPLIKPNSRSLALMQYVDVVPTVLEVAGRDPKSIDTGCADAQGQRGFDGRSFLPLLTDAALPFRDYVYAQHTTVGVNGYLQPYPSRMVRDARYKLIRNLAPEHTFTIGGIHKGQPLASWQEDARSDTKLAARIEWLFKRPGEELYDLETDPFEMKNLAGNPELDAIKTRLQKELDAWMQQQGDEGLDTELQAPTRRGKADEESGASGKRKKGKPKAKAN
jgi:N-sulfoglucosamine sulfohydrolase